MNTKTKISSCSSSLKDGFIIPLSDCTLIQNEIVSHKGCKIVINKNIYYTELDIQACKNMHEMKEIKDKIFREIAWFERAKTHSIPPGLNSVH